MKYTYTMVGGSASRGEQKSFATILEMLDEVDADLMVASKQSQVVQVGIAIPGMHAIIALGCGLTIGIHGVRGDASVEDERTLRGYLGALFG